MVGVLLNTANNSLYFFMQGTKCVQYVYKQTLGGAENPFAGEKKSGGLKGLSILAAAMYISYHCSACTVHYKL